MEPFATVEKALQQLDTAKPTLAAMFADLGTLDGYCDWLHLAIAATRKRFLFFQSLDLAHEEPEWFRAHLTYALGVFEQRVPLAVGRKSLLHLSAWDSAKPFPAPANLIWPSAGDAWTDQEKSSACRWSIIPAERCTWDRTSRALNATLQQLLTKLKFSTKMRGACLTAGAYMPADSAIAR